METLIGIIIVIGMGLMLAVLGALIDTRSKNRRLRAHNFNLALQLEADLRLMRWLSERARASKNSLERTIPILDVLKEMNCIEAVLAGYCEFDHLARIRERSDRLPSPPTPPPSRRLKESEA